MSAASFEQEIQDGVIPLPKELRPRFTGRVHVMVWSEDAAEQVGDSDLIDELIESPMAAFKPFTRDEIYEDR
ncbi:MAG: hypothetical protein K1X78_01470 [Verrucomicrobiaceae bacterium]|nr:hypothetical protein [Verrucomicrobiaceae bacterium]